MDYKFSNLKIGVEIAGLRFPKNFVSSRAWSKTGMCYLFYCRAKCETSKCAAGRIEDLKLRQGYYFYEESSFCSLKTELVHFTSHIIH